MYQITNNSVRLKQINVELVKSVLKSSEYCTKASIANATGLSVATCGNILEELLKSRVVIALDLEESSGGRPARKYAYNPDHSYIAMIYGTTEVGVNSLAYSVANILGEIKEQNSVKVEVVNINAIDHLIDNLIGRYENIKAVGIGIPGVVHRGVIGICDLPELTGVSLEQHIREKYKIEAVVENDMNLTVIGFYKNQKYSLEETIAFITFPKDNFPGAGFIVDGQLIKGKSKFAGEISFLPFGISREDQLEQLRQEESLIPLVAKTVISVISVINPAAVALAGQTFREEMLFPLYELCVQSIPEEHMPKIIVVNDKSKHYIRGLIDVTLEQLACNVKLVEKRK